jgi:hypothetical protein
LVSPTESSPDDSLVSGEVESSHVYSIVTTARHDEQVFALAWRKDWDNGITCWRSNNRGANNRSFYANPNGAPGAFRYASQGFLINNLNGFNQTNGETAASTSTRRRWTTS